MSIEECGLSCVHVTPSTPGLPPPRASPDQRLDMHFRLDKSLLCCRARREQSI
ncbi:hypothetical protein T484DRAFT_1824999 [Baffinella frigidus]|nr:hypothetical protein T484DRAFT_1824999 [Cryptophyta sp. CCMP2293]